MDENTGRLMFGRRYSDGLHQAIEAKEHVEVKNESQTLATITFQNYFRLYSKLAGMTGTAKTEEDEFRKIYALDVVQVPTNKPVVRNGSSGYYLQERGAQAARHRGGDPADLLQAAAGAGRHPLHRDERSASAPACAPHALTTLCMVEMAREQDRRQQVAWRRTRRKNTPAAQSAAAERAEPRRRSPSAR